MPKNKLALRAQASARRALFARSKVESDSLRICRRAVKLIRQKQPRQIHCYIDNPQKNEIMTGPIFEFCWRNDIKCYVPLLDKNGKFINKYGRFVHGDKIILHPGGYASVDKRPARVKPQMVIVPCLLADKQSHRLGQGGGYYDRLLSRLPQAMKAGLCYEEMLADELPAESHDQLLDVIITPRRTTTRP